MDALIIRSLQGRASPAEERRLLRWRAESEENDRKYREIARVLALCRSVAQVPTSPPPDARQIIARARRLEEEGDAAA